MEPHCRQLKAGKFVAIYSTRVNTDFIFADKGIGKGRVPEDDLFAEIAFWVDKGISNPYHIFKWLVLYVYIRPETGMDNIVILKLDKRHQGL